MEIDLSNCQFIEDSDSEYTLKDVVIEMFVHYVNKNSDVKIERKK